MKIIIFLECDTVYSEVQRFGVIYCLILHGRIYSLLISHRICLVSGD
jgi:hypothetical protein